MRSRQTSAPVLGTPRGATLIVLTVAFALAATACSAPSPAPLVRREVAATEETDPARPCTRQAPTDGPAGPAPSGVTARFDRATNTIELTAAQDATLPALVAAVQDPAALREIAPGAWLLGADLVVSPGSSLEIRRDHREAHQQRGVPTTSASTATRSAGWSCRTTRSTTTCCTESTRTHAHAIS